MSSVSAKSALLSKAAHVRVIVVLTRIRTAVRCLGTHRQAERVEKALHVLSVVKQTARVVGYAFDDDMAEFGAMLDGSWVIFSL